jgi:hypothetical protein
MEKIKNLIIYVILIISYLGFYSWGLYHGQQRCECPEQKEKIKIKDTLPELTLDNVLIELIKQDVKHPLIVLKQVIWETGHLKCKNCSLDVNNLLGFAWTGKSYRKYNHWTESIKDYKIYQLKYYKGGDYYQFLEDIGYAESQEYCNSLRSIKL